MIKSIVKTTYKYFWKNRKYNIINIIGLTVSISSIFIILLYIGNERKYDAQIRNRENIYRLTTNWAPVPSYIGHYLKDQTEFISDMVRVKIEDHEITSNNQVFKLNHIGMADKNFFDVFNFNFILGNRENALNTLHSIVLTQSEAKRIFGNANPMNKEILLKNRYPFTVTGVIRDPDYFHLPFMAIATLESLNELAYKDILEQKDGWSYYTYIVGKPGLSRKETEERIDGEMKAIVNRDHPYRLTSLSDLYFSPPMYYEGITLHGNKMVLYILFSIAVLLLILAGINFINLTHARAYIRFRELGIKKLVGGSKSILIIQLLADSVLIVLLAFAISWPLLRIVQPYFCTLIGKPIDFSPIFSPANFLLVTAAILLVGLLAGLFPALTLNSTEPITLLKSKTDPLLQKSVFGKSLITFQYCISILLIAGTLIILKQLNFLKKKDLGFSPDQIVCLELNDNLKQQQVAFKNELLKIPGVLQAAYSGNRMGNEWSNWVNDIDNKGCAFKVNNVEPGYFDLMDIKIKEGRAFQKEDVNKYYIINETAARKYEWSKPLEITMKRDDKYYQVIGVTEDFNFQSPQYPIEPVLFYLRNDRYNILNLKITTTNTGGVIAAIEKVWKKFSPAYAFEYSFLDELYNRQYKSAEQFSMLVGIGGGIAILIACLGILGLSVSSSEQKIKEIGIRKINGARISEVMIMLNKDFVKWVVIAFFMATPLAWYIMHKWLGNFACKTTLSWWIFALAGLLALGIAALTVSWQSWRAAKRNPVEALRYE